MIEKVYESRGIRMHYWIGGKKGGKMILWLHGMGGCLLAYKKHLEMLSKRYLVVAPELPGFGKSDLPDRVWDFGNYAEFLEGLLKDLKLSKVVVVGNSFGGGIAFYLAVRSNRVDKLVLNGSAGLPTDLNEWGLYWWMVRTYGGKLIQLRKKWVWDIIQAFLANLKYRGRKGFGLMKKTVMKCALVDSTEVIRQVKVPTLILWGKRDNILPAEKYAKKFHELIKGSELILTDGDHTWCTADPEKCVGLVKEWVD